MISRVLTLASLVSVVLLQAGCLQAPVAIPIELQSPEELWNLDELYHAAEWNKTREQNKSYEGFTYKELTFEPSGGSRKLFVYVPRARPGMKHEPKSLRCVLVAPGGSNMLTGMELGDGDRPEHIPYIPADCVVIAYGLDGRLKGDRDEDVAEAYLEYVKSGAGLANAKHAFEYALNEMDMVDPDQIHIAGHSSAGLHALLFAAHEPRLAGCAAYCPATNIGDSVTPDLVEEIGHVLPGLKEFIVKASPLTHVSKIECPVYLFGAKLDEVVPYSRILKFKNELAKTNKKIMFVTSPGKDHYQSMIDHAMKSSVSWVAVEGRKENADY